MSPPRSSKVGCSPSPPRPPVISGRANISKARPRVSARAYILRAWPGPPGLRPQGAHGGSASSLRHQSSKLRLAPTAITSAEHGPGNARGNRAHNGASLRRRATLARSRWTSCRSGNLRTPPAAVLSAGPPNPWKCDGVVSVKCGICSLPC